MSKIRSQELNESWSEVVTGKLEGQWKAKK